MRARFQQVTTIRGQKQYHTVELAPLTGDSAKDQKVKKENLAKLQAMAKEGTLAASIFADPALEAQAEAKLKQMVEVTGIQAAIHKQIVQGRQGEQVLVSADPTRVDVLAAIGL